MSMISGSPELDRLIAERLFHYKWKNRLDRLGLYLNRRELVSPDHRPIFDDEWEDCDLSVPSNAARLITYKGPEFSTRLTACYMVITNRVSIKDYAGVQNNYLEFEVKINDVCCFVAFKDKIGTTSYYQSDDKHQFCIGVCCAALLSADIDPKTVSDVAEVPVEYLYSNFRNYM